MKWKLNATDLLPPPEARRGTVNSENLTAIVWETDDECLFAVFRRDPLSGCFRHSLRAQDVMELAGLVTVLAEALRCQVPLDEELSDDLGRLARALSRTLGLDLDEIERTVKETVQ